MAAMAAMAAAPGATYVAMPPARPSPSSSLTTIALSLLAITIVGVVVYEMRQRAKPASPAIEKPFDPTPSATSALSATSATAANDASDASTTQPKDMKSKHDREKLRAQFIKKQKADNAQRVSSMMICKKNARASKGGTCEFEGNNAVMKCNHLQYGEECAYYCDVNGGKKRYVSGTDLGTNRAKCEDLACLNGGTLSGSTCVCATGFSGPKCQHDVSSCRTTDLYATIKDDGSCQCSDGYNGKECTECDDTHRYFLDATTKKCEQAPLCNLQIQSSVAGASQTGLANTGSTAKTFSLTSIPQPTSVTVTTTTPSSTNSVECMVQLETSDNCKMNVTGSTPKTLAANTTLKSAILGGQTAVLNASSSKLAYCSA